MKQVTRIESPSASARTNARRSRSQVPGPRSDPGSDVEGREYRVSGPGTWDLGRGPSPRPASAGTVAPTRRLPKRRATPLALAVAGLLLAASARPALAAVDDDVPGGALEAEIDGQYVPLPLLKTDMDAAIRGDLATVRLVQTFENPESQPLHARYVFPLPPDAAVYAMRLTAGEQVIEAEIREREAARAVFDEARRAGRQAALLSQQRPNVFVQEVANLTPGVPVKVEISYAHVVPREDENYEFHFPMIVGPRYVPPARGGEGEPEPVELGQWTLPASAPVAGPPVLDTTRVGLQVDLDAGMPIEWVDSPSHPIAVDEEGAARRRIHLQSGRTLDNKDFILRYRLAAAEARTGVTAHADGEDKVLSLLIEPPAKAVEAQITPREMVFVLDCSGSMAGVPLETSKRFVRRALADLRPTDSFRIIQFSYAAASVSAAPLPATATNVRRGLDYLDGLRGEGGTEMTTGIRAALDPAVEPGVLRLVVFLTDGYIGNDADIVRLIQQRRGEARLFSFGIGTAVNRYLIAEMARAGHGVARVVLPSEDAAAAAATFAKRLESPYVTDLRIDWGGVDVSDVAPALLPDLFLGQGLHVLARYRTPGRQRLTVHGKIGGKPVSLPVEVDLPAREDAGEALPILWARGLVENRMIDYLDPARGMDERERIRGEVTKLGLEHRLVTQWTSFVAVARDTVNPGGQGVCADVAVPPVEGVARSAYPTGTQSVGRPQFAAPAMQPAAAPAANGAAAPGGGGFGGEAAPEPREWAILFTLLALATLFLARRVEA